MNLTTTRPLLLKRHNDVELEKEGQRASKNCISIIAILQKKHALLWLLPMVGISRTCARYSIINGEFIPDRFQIGRISNLRGRRLTTRKRGTHTKRVIRPFLSCDTKIELNAICLHLFTVVCLGVCVYLIYPYMLGEIGGQNGKEWSWKGWNIILNLNILLLVIFIVSHHIFKRNQTDFFCYWTGVLKPYQGHFWQRKTDPKSLSQECHMDGCSLHLL